MADQAVAGQTVVRQRRAEQLCKDEN